MTKRKYRYTAVFFAAVFQLLLLTGCTFSNTDQNGSIDSEIREEEALPSNSNDDTVKAENVVTETGCQQCLGRKLPYRKHRLFFSME